MYNDLEAGPVLIIAPKRVAETTWTTEAAKWEHLRHLRVCSLTGNSKRREAGVRDALDSRSDIYVINRENVEWLVDAAGQGWPWPIVVVDELSSFKSAQAKRWKALRRVRGRIRRVIGLTGTPRPNGLEDLWPEMYLLDGGQRLGRTLSAFRSQFLFPAAMNGHIVYKYAPKPGAEEECYRRIGDICMSLRKEDVLSLPGQTYLDVPVRLPDAVLKQYKAFERDCLMEATADAGEVTALSAATLTNKLLQFANGAVYDNDGGVRGIHTAKLEALQELVEQAGGDNVLVLYAYKHDADRIAKAIACRRLDTPDDIADWNAGKIPVAIAHPASIGHGLNLQFGGHITVWFGLPWSLELYEQANERLNRPGQTEVCRVYHLIAEGTHDARVLKSLQDKEVGQSGAIAALRLELKQ